MCRVCGTQTMTVDGTAAGTYLRAAALLASAVVCFLSSLLLLGARQGPSQVIGLADTASNVEGFGTSPLAPTAEHQRLLQTTSGSGHSVTITIANSNSNLQWIGRVITGKSDTRVFDWGGCAVRMRITGTTRLGLVVKVGDGRDKREGGSSIASAFPL